MIPDYVVHGGSWLDHPDYAQCTCHRWYSSDYDWFYYGLRTSFRLIRENGKEEEGCLAGQQGLGGPHRVWIELTHSDVHASEAPLPMDREITRQ